TPPHIVITAPAPGTSIAAGTPLTLAATATDDFDPTVDVRWSSSLAGALGTGSRLTVNLGEGVHTLTATAVDSDGAGTAATVVLRPPNAGPRITIQAPADGSPLLSGKPVLLAATASDAEDGDLGAAVRWTSSRDGLLGTGALRTVASLSAGTHVLTAAVIDRDGATASASVTVTVGAASLVFAPVADTYVDVASPTKRFGAATTLQAASSPLRQAFLRF